MAISLDDLLAIVGNPIRRQILEKLARESHYPLQLSKELNVSQQAIMKHLKTLERMKLVTSQKRPSEIGPPRKYYKPTTRFSLIIDLGTNTFKARVYSLPDRPEEPKRCSTELNTLLDALTTASSTADRHERFLKLSQLIERVDALIKQLESDRNSLLMLRSRIMQQAQDLIADLSDEYEHRNLLYYLIEDSHRDIDSISEHLNMRVKVIEQMVDELTDLDLPMDELLGLAIDEVGGDRKTEPDDEADRDQ